MEYLQSLFSLHDKTAVITGGGGVLGRALALALARAGAKVVVMSLHMQSAQKVAEAIQAEGRQAMALACDVTDGVALAGAYQLIRQTFGPIDILVNGAGGNRPQATTSPTQPFFQLDPNALEQASKLNFMGTLLPCQIFGEGMAERSQGCIVNISSMAALRTITNVVAYSAAKSAVTNFTQWLAVHMAQQYSPRIRVNALAPGFFLTEQNRFLLTNEHDGSFTLRGQAILAHTPAQRLGEPEDLVSTLLWLVSPASSFVTGVVVPVDGGFSIFSGV
jgi:NAD(P)-dependent dehydrogenase (short-subunit alcohol dehydrogenase family)